MSYRRILAAVLVLSVCLVQPAWAGDCKYFNVSAASVVRALPKVFKMDFVDGRKPQATTACGPNEMLMENVELDDQYKGMGFGWSLRITGAAEDKLTDIYFEVSTGPKSHRLHKHTKDGAAVGLINLEELFNIPIDTDFNLALSLDFFQPEVTRRFGNVLVTTGYKPHKDTSLVYIRFQQFN